MRKLLFVSTLLVSAFGASLALANPTNYPAQSSHSYGADGVTYSAGGTSVYGQGQPDAVASSSASTYGSEVTGYKVNNSSVTGTTTNNSTSYGSAKNDATYSGYTNTSGNSGGYTYSGATQY